MKYLYDSGENISLTTEDMTEVLASFKYPARLRINRIPDGPSFIITTSQGKKPVIRSAETKRKSLLRKLFYSLACLLTGNRNIILSLVLRQGLIHLQDVIHVYNCIREEMSGLVYLHQKHFNEYSELSWEGVLTETRPCYYRLASREKDIMPYSMFDVFCEDNDMEFPREGIYSRKVRYPGEARKIIDKFPWNDKQGDDTLKIVRVEVI
jgi:hypothetical protein